MRRALRAVHKWIGLVAGIATVILGLSGTALVYRAELERWQARNLPGGAAAGERVPLDVLVTTANAAWPAKRLTRIVFPPSPADPMQVVLQTPGAPNLKDAELVTVYVNPYDGAVLGSIERNGTWIWWLQDLHYAWFMGEPGLKANGMFALALLLLALSGPVLWWPGRKRLSSSLRVRPQPAAARWRDLHAVSGIAACLALGLIALTALYYAYRAPATALVTWASGDAPLRPPAVAGSGSPLASLAAIQDGARRALPEATIDELRPGRPGAPASVTFRLPGDHLIGRHRAWIDPVSAELLRVDRHDRLAPGQRLLGNMAPWHYGTFGGPVTRLLWFVSGLVPALLFATGVWLWARRRRAGRAASTIPLHAGEPGVR